MLEKDAILSKISIIRNCLDQINEITNLNPDKLDELIAQDVFILNFERCVQASIGIAHILIAKNGWKMPASYKESFFILLEKKVIDEGIFKNLAKLTAFKNIAFLEYIPLNTEVLKTLMKYHLIDFQDFYEKIFSYVNLPEFVQ